MTNNIKFRIGNLYVFSNLIMPIALFLFTTYFLIFGRPTTKDLTPMIMFDVFCFPVAIFGIKKYFILAAEELTALELNENEIIDHVFNIRVNWDNVADIRFVKQGVGGYISIYLKDKQVVITQTKNILKKFSFYINSLFNGATVRIQPGYIKGKNSDIFEKIDAYFKAISFGDMSLPN